MRLSISSLAGTVRTLVAVGTLRLEAMLTAVRAAAPRSVVAGAPAAAGGPAAGGVAGAGAASGFGGAVAGAAAWAGALAWLSGPVWGGAGRAGLGARGGELVGPPFVPWPGAAAWSGWPCSRAARAATLPTGGGESAKKFHQAMSTERGSAR